MAASIWLTSDEVAFLSNEMTPIRNIELIGEGNHNIDLPGLACER
ncbi:hypothetical protein [Cupriavidus necator]